MSWTFIDLPPIHQHKAISSRRNADKCVSLGLGKENCWIDKFSWSGRSAKRHFAFPISGWSQAWHFLSLMPTLLSCLLIRLKTSIFGKDYWNYYIGYILNKRKVTFLNTIQPWKMKSATLIFWQIMIDLKSSPDWDEKVCNKQFWPLLHSTWMHLWSCKTHFKSVVITKFDISK